MEFIRTNFQSFFEDTTITANFLKGRICNTSCIEINTLFAIFNKVRPNHTMLKDMDAG